MRFPQTPEQWFGIALLTPLALLVAVMAVGAVFAWGAIAYMLIDALL